MKSKNLMSNIRRSVSLLFLCIGIHSCANPCDEEGVRITEAINNGDVEALREYLDNGGDPLFECAESRSGTYLDATGRAIYYSVMLNESFKMNECYLQYDIPKDIKNEMFELFVGRKNDSLIDLYLKNGAHLSTAKCYFGERIEDFEYLSEKLYDFNLIDPESGNTLLMDYCACPAPDNPNELIEVLSYLIEKGGEIDLKNKKGNNAIDLAVNTKVKKYLMDLK